MKKNKNVSNQQISIDDLCLSVGDKLYKDNELYALVSAVTESLYMLCKASGDSNIAIPYRKEILINQILSGAYTIEEVKF